MGPGMCYPTPSGEIETLQERQSKAIQQIALKLYRLAVGELTDNWMFQDECDAETFGENLRLIHECFQLFIQ